MSTGSETDVHDRTATDVDEEEDDGQLRSVLVKYERGADRRTVYPSGADDHERMTHWFTADDAAFVGLETHR